MPSNPKAIKMMLILILKNKYYEAKQKSLSEDK